MRTGPSRSLCFAPRPWPRPQSYMELLMRYLLWRSRSKKYEDEVTLHYIQSVKKRCFCPVFVVSFSFMWPDALTRSDQCSQQNSCSVQTVPVHWPLTLSPHWPHISSRHQSCAVPWPECRTTFYCFFSLRFFDPTASSSKLFHSSEILKAAHPHFTRKNGARMVSGGWWDIGFSDFYFPDLKYLFEDCQNERINVYSHLKIRFLHQ